MDCHEYTVARWRARRPSLVRHGATSSSTTNLIATRHERDRRDSSAPRATPRRHTLRAELRDVGLARRAPSPCGRRPPTEAQWSTPRSAGRLGRTDPVAARASPAIEPCTGASRAALQTGLAGDGRCPSTRAREPGDVSALGIVGLGGGVAELLRDAFFGLEAPCWRSAGLARARPRATRGRGGRSGGDWTINAVGVGSEARRQAETPTSYGAVDWLSMCRREQGSD